MMEPILDCQNLSKKYGNFFALSNLTLSLEKGQIVGLLGPNGSGKTTLIKLINGLLTPTSGHVLINQMDPCTQSRDRLYHSGRKHGQCCGKHQVDLYPQAKPDGRIYRPLLRILLRTGRP